MIRRLAASLVIALVALAGAAPAYADDDMGFSTDGTHWSATPPDALFPASMRWVPGDVEQSAFYVRNQGPTGAKMTINAFTSDAARLLSNGAVVISARVGSGPWTALTAGHTRVRPAVLKVARNATSKVTVQVRFARAVTAPMDRTASFRLRILLFQAGGRGVGPGDDGNGNGGSGSGHGGLPDTGSPVTMAWIWLAAALIGSGIAMVAPRRRREADHG